MQTWTPSDAPQGNATAVVVEVDVGAGVEAAGLVAENGDLLAESARLSGLLEASLQEARGLHEEVSSMGAMLDALKQEAKKLCEDNDDIKGQRDGLEEENEEMVAKYEGGLDEQVAAIAAK